MDINIKIENKRAEAIGAPVIVCGNSDYTIFFQFDSEWDEYPIKTARFLFYRDGKWQSVDAVVTNDRVAVPTLSRVAFVDIGVFAGDLHTTTKARVPCLRSILCEDGTPPDPTPELYAQLMQVLNDNYPLEAGIAANEAAERANRVREEVEAGGYIESLKELNQGSKFSVWVGSSAEYAALETKRRNCLYILTDEISTQELLDQVNALREYVDETDEKIAKTKQEFDSQCVQYEADIAANAEGIETNRRAIQANAGDIDACAKAINGTRDDLEADIDKRFDYLWSVDDEDGVGADSWMIVPKSKKYSLFSIRIKGTANQVLAIRTETTQANGAKTIYVRGTTGMVLDTSSVNIDMRTKDYYFMAELTDEGDQDEKWAIKAVTSRIIDGEGEVGYLDFERISSIKGIL